MTPIEVLRNLSVYFQIGPVAGPERLNEIELASTAAGATTIGIEVEVKYSSYFPDLFDKYELNVRPISVMTEEDLAAFSKETAERELVLLPKLNKTVELGVPKGKDRYWEFAFDPVFNPRTLTEQILILQSAGLIPYDNHSLHLTLGGLTANKPAYMLLMCLEMLGWSSEKRIKAGVKKNKGVAWGKKGFGGIRHRTEGVLYEKGTAVEFRTLEFPTDNLHELLYVAWFLAECIRRPDLNHVWEKVSDQLESIALKHGLDTSKNWGRAFDDVDLWNYYAEALPLINKNELRMIIRNAVESVDTSLPNNSYLKYSWVR